MKNKIGWLIVGVICCVLVVRCFIADLITVHGDSMLPNYSDKNVVLVTKLNHNYERFDVVVISCGYGNIIKRIIGLPGNTVQIIDGHIYIDGCILDDFVDMQIDDAGIAADPVTLMPDEYFVLGDNRNASQDSRNDEIGIIKKNQIVGIVNCKIWR